MRHAIFLKWKMRVRGMVGGVLFSCTHVIRVSHHAGI